ncbi:MAG: Rne/Rng family ribonuclease [Pelagibacteraceae bacterium]|nr:Rne/Rng family ribonuclease [Pelagibacteraceae bacterium]
MERNLYIDASHPNETRVVLKSEENIEDYEYESKKNILVRSNIYLGKVSRVEPSLQAAFVDIGRERHGFLAFNDIQPDYYQIPQGDIRDLKQKEEELREKLKEESKKLEENNSLSTLDEDFRNGKNGFNNADVINAEELNSANIELNSVKKEIDRNVNEIVNIEKKFDKPRQSFGSKKYKIQEVIKPNQIILVQVLKDERGKKGAALSTFISLAGKYTILMPNTPKGGGISRKIFNPINRKKIRGILNEIKIPKEMGLIVRTAGDNKTKNEINYDLENLIKIWEEVKKRAMNSLAPALVHEEGDVIKRTIRDIYNEKMKNIIVEGNEGYQKAKNFMKQIMPKSVKCVKKYRGKIPLFHKEGIEKKLNQIFEPILKLKSGGYIVINPTEALVSIDINSGKSTREINVERTALATNLEAADEIARQIKVRDLAGLIIIDFIDMFNFNNRRMVEKRLRDNFKNDRARIQLERISNFGLLEMSRQRLRESSVQWNIILTLDSFSSKILKLAEEQALSNKIKNVNIKVAEKVIKTIKEQFDDELSYCKKKHKLQINFIIDNSLIIPEYKIELLNKNKKIIKILEHEAKPKENLNHNKFYPKSNRKFLNKRLKSKKIQLFRKYKNKKYHKRPSIKNYKSGIKI